MNMHRGTAALRLKDSVLKGDYYTGRGRREIGAPQDDQGPSDRQRNRIALTTCWRDGSGPIGVGPGLGIAGGAEILRPVWSLTASLVAPH